jgi:hypothetical protein
MYLSSGVMMDKILRMVLLWPLFDGVWVAVSSVSPSAEGEEMGIGEPEGLAEVEEGKESVVAGGPGRSWNATPIS